MTVKENVKNADVWCRGFFILIFGFIYYLLFFLLLLIVLFQFFTKLLTTELNAQLLDFSDGLIRYIAQILHYVTFKSDERPYPFSPWPGNLPAKVGKKKTAKKKNSTRKKDNSGDTEKTDD